MISYHTESFPVEKFQDYGCHCRESLNRNLPGLGRGLDAIDAGILSQNVIVKIL